MFKFNLNQLVWYIENNKFHSANIISRIYIDNKIKDVHGKEQTEAFQQFGADQIQYGTVHGAYTENQLFASKEELVTFLSADETSAE